MKRLRILWLTASPLPEVTAAMKISRNLSSGPWMQSLLDCMRRCDEFEFISACYYPGLPSFQCKIDRVEHFISGGRRHFFQYLSHNSGLGQLGRLLAKLQPDVVHVHGTENQYGLLQKEAQTPRFIYSIQGLVHKCAPMVFGVYSPVSALRKTSLIEGLRGTSLWGQRIRYWHAGLRELKVIRAAKYVFGRTHFDREAIRAISPDISYFHADEVLRPIFYSTRWRPRENKNPIIYINNASSPLKGAEIVIQACSRLLAVGVRARLRISGVPLNGNYRRLLNEFLKKSGFAVDVELLGMLGAEAVAKELSDADIYVSASFMDNSPNSLCEAQLLGVPCVASKVGGVESIVMDRKTGLLFKPGDFVALAEALRALIQDPAWSASLSQAGRDAALCRHDKTKIVDQYALGYRCCARLQAK